MNGIGGDGFWLVREPSGRVRALMAAGRAGEHARPELYREPATTTIPARGPLAALTVPGAIGGWMLALEAAKAHGRHAAARRAARPRHPPGRRRLRRWRAAWPASRRRVAGELKDVPGFAQTFLVDGKPPAAGAMLQADRRSPRRSNSSRMPGSTISIAAMSAREIAADLERIGSPVTRADLERYAADCRRAAVGRARRRHALQHAAADAGARLADHPRAVRAAAASRRRRASITCTG